MGFMDVASSDHLSDLRDLLIRGVSNEWCLGLFRQQISRKEFISCLFCVLDEDKDGFVHRDVLVSGVRAHVSGNRVPSHLQAHLLSIICAKNPLFDSKTFYQIVTNREVQDLIFHLIDTDKDEVVSFNQVMEFLAHLTQARPRCGLTPEDIEHVQNVFREATRGQEEINFEDFRKLIKSKNVFFTERVFRVFDRDASGSVSLQEFLDSIANLASQSPDDKINFLFRIYDLDGDGFIQHSELRHVMRACMEENGMKFSEEQIEDLTTALFEDADPRNTGAITFEALKAQLAKHDGLLENLSTSIERWLIPPRPEPPLSLLNRLQSLLPHWAKWRYVRNNHVFLAFLFLFLFVNVALFASRAYQYRDSNGFVILARACGQCLNFTCTMVLVFMLRNCITWLRSNGMSYILPLDDHILFHKLAGSLIVGFALVHTIMHICNFSTLAETSGANITASEYLFTAKSGTGGLIPGCASITGDLLVLVLLIMILCSLRCVRKSGKFEVFYWTHQLYVLFWFLLILHGPNFWKWFVVPATIYILERIIRGVRLAMSHGKTTITEGVLLPSKVTHLVIRRPPHFTYCPGDYIFVRIPAIAESEWHPFTLSSAPEQQDSLWLHIRAVGEWTNRLHEYVDAQHRRLQRLESIVIEDVNGDEMSGNTSTKQSVVPKKSVRIDIGRSNLSYEKNINGDEIAEKTSTKQSVVPKKSVRIDIGHGDLSYETNINGDEMSENTSTKQLVVPKKSVRIDVGHSNLSYEKDMAETAFVSQSSDTLSTPTGGPIRISRIHKPLTASRSLPNFGERVKHREKLLWSRQNPRSASEKSFDGRFLRRARATVNGSNVSRRNRCSMAQSFKYLRHKPNVVQLSPLPNVIQEEENFDGEELDGVQIAAARKESTVDALEHVLRRPLEIYVDGPFGAPSSHIFRAQHAVLIATGIGVTPFASILQSIMRRYWKERHTCPKCQHSWTGEVPQSVMNLRKVDFFWINRDQRSFEWFVNLLSQLEIEQAELGGAMERFLDMHMYITSALQRADMKALGLQLALDLLHEREKRDLITGLKTRTQAGRPNWNKIFKQISEQRKGKVTVFYCGPPELGRLLQVKCDEFGFTFRKEVF